MFTIELTEQEGVLIRNLIDMGLKKDGLPSARVLLALDDKLVQAARSLAEAVN